jgi:Asp-tRNA(Asn)/Glu-tRNA(Gln) amidotransferase C subunit
MSDFLFHKVGEKEKQEIKKQAKDIIEDFSKKLAILDEDVKESIIEREKGERTESKTEKSDSDFREIMFKNAPNKNENFILAEKKQW